MKEKVMKKETLLSERRTEDSIFGDVNGANVQNIRKL